jgi:hypothetical protein
MTVPDVNLLVYAVDEESPFHERSRHWWDGVLSSTGVVGLCYPSILGFVRMTTNRHVFASPLSVGDALDRVGSWIDQPNAVLLTPTGRHWSILSGLLREADVGANLTTDAHIAAYAMEHAGTLYSNDGDFARFDGLRWRNPLAA